MNTRWTLLIVGMTALAPLVVLPAAAEEGPDDDRPWPPGDASGRGSGAGDGADSDARARAHEWSSHRAEGAPAYDAANSTFDGQFLHFVLAEGAILNLTLFDHPVAARVDVPGLTSDANEVHARGPFLEIRDGEFRLKAADMRSPILELEAEGLIVLHLDAGVEILERSEDGFVARAGNATFAVRGDDLSGPPPDITSEDELKILGRPGRAHQMQQREPAEDHRPHGHFQVAEGLVEGRFVRFMVDRSLPGVEAYGLTRGEVLVFEEIRLPGSGNATVRLDGARFQMRSGNATLQLLDTPNAVGLYRANGTIQLVVAEGIPVETNRSDGNRSVFHLQLPGNHTMIMAGHNLTWDNATRTFTVEDQAQSRLILRGFDRDDAQDARDRRDDRRDRDEGRPDRAEDIRDRRDDRRGRAVELREEFRERIETAIAEGRIQVEVFADGDGAEPVAVELGHVKVRNVRASGDDRVRAHLDIEAPDGSPSAVVVLNLDAHDLGNLTVAGAAAGLAVTFDGEVIQAADDLADILHCTADEAPEYLLLVGAAKVQVLVCVPHFSPHTIEVVQAQSADGEPIERGTPVPALAVLAGVGLAALARRRDP